MKSNQKTDNSFSYKKYKWFFTSSERLVVGGKSAAQNDQLITDMKKGNQNFVVMHTSEPGSPFSFIVSDPKKISQKDIKEAAIFTGCFSRAWKSRKKQTNIDIFTLSQLSKEKDMKQGTWRVTGPVKRMSVQLELALVIQEGVLRAIPSISAKGNDIICKIIPGSIDKLDMVTKLALESDKTFSQEEVLSALPSGGIKVIKNE